jgi:hypothetical protein
VICDVISDIFTLPVSVEIPIATDQIAIIRLREKNVIFILFLSPLTAIRVAIKILSTAEITATDRVTLTM